MLIEEVKARMGKIPHFIGGGFSLFMENDYTPWDWSHEVALNPVCIM